MAKAALIRSPTALVDLPPAFTGQPTDEYMQAVGLWLRKLADKVNGKLSLGDDNAFSVAGNVDAQIIPHTFSSADTAETIPHGLSRKPSFALLLDSNKVGVIYIENHDAWTADAIVLKSFAAGHRATLLVW